MRRHIRDLLAGQTKGKTAENRLAEPTSGVLGTHVNPEGLTAGPFPYALTRINLYKCPYSHDDLSENMGKTAGQESKNVHIQLASVARLSLSFIKY